MNVVSNKKTVTEIFGAVTTVVGAAGKLGEVIQPMTDSNQAKGATYAQLNYDKDLTDYLYAYVGKGSALGEAIELACSREGDPDLYADVKYKQNIQVFAYPCVGDEIETKYQALNALFL